MSERKAFKDYFDPALVRRIAGWLSKAEPGFEGARFIRLASRGLDELEMMARVGHIADAMNLALPGPTAFRMRALVESLPPLASTADGITDYGYALWPYGDFIARYGLDDVDASFVAMIELTQRFTSEFAVRPFLAQDPDGILDSLEVLVGHESEHVRRWVSEGTRTRLPWGKRVPILEERLDRRLKLLTALRADPSRYVQRSVANHMGDILKDDPDKGLLCLAAWMKEKDPHIEWVVRHAARALLKQGDLRALKLFGLSPSPELHVERFVAQPKKVVLGTATTLELCLINRGPKARKVRLDYRLFSPGAGAKQNVKTFRICDTRLDAGQSLEKQFKHAFVQRSIRTVRPGTHRIALLVNGVEAASLELKVTANKLE